MEYAAIFHDMDKMNCYALEKGRFLIRIRTKKGDMRKIILHMQDKYIPTFVLDTYRTVCMKKVVSDAYHDYYECEVKLDAICERYFFELTDMQWNVVYYGNYQFFEDLITDIECMFDCPQNLREEECFQVPEWAANQVAYQIFPSSFASSRPQEDQLWYKAPVGRGDNLQGDLQGIIAHLPHLRELGVDILYMTPIFQANTNHKYDTVDYFKIDPSFGTEEDLSVLVEKAHALGMRVILDGVFNHTSTDFFAFADIRKNQERSPYLDWYFIEGFPLRSVRGEKPNYKTFGYFGGMPKLNVKNPQVEEYIFQVVTYWMEHCKIDGWRLDVGDEIGHRFWKRFREKVKSVNPDALIVGEVWHPAFDYLQGDEWDTVMNYHFYQAVLDFVARESINAGAFMERMGYMKGRVHSKVFPILWNLLDSHDTARFLHCCRGDVQKLRLAAAIQLLSEGIPMIYYGDEFGMTGGKDPDCRRGMLWKEEYQNRELFDWYKRLIHLRKEFPCIIKGELVEIKTDQVPGLVELRKKDMIGEVIILFYNGKEEAPLPEKAGMYDAITQKRFGGVLLPYQALVLI